MYEEPSMATPPQASRFAAPSMMATYQAPMPASYVTSTVSGIPYATVCGYDGGGEAARPDSLAYAASRRKASNEEVLATEDWTYQPRPAVDTYPPVRRYPSYTALRTETVRAGSS